jgi:uncharacterized protein (DUF952 family)
MDIIYHITTADEWKAAQQTGSYEAASLKEEGFIHCSQAEQVPEVLARYFSGKTGLVKLSIDPKKLTSRLIYEWSPSLTQTFPHIYGPINLEAVISAESIQQ